MAEKLVAIIGRPNVGKSTFFNRMTKQRQAIVDAVSGVTRDRHYGKSDWNGSYFSLVDTGGYITGSEDEFEAQIRRQVLIAIEEADVIIFMVDVQSGVTDMDQDVAAVLRKSDKPIFLVVNKVDTPIHAADATEFYSLGLGEYYTLSSINGSGTGELLDEVVKHIPRPEEEEDEDENALPRFAIVGRPNVGKSSLLNALMGEERNIVTNIAGTTRDSLNTIYNQFGLNFELVDTAGIRKKGKVHEDLEFYSVMRAIRAIEYSDVILLVIDGTADFESQDLNIFHLAERNKKGVVILVNKWDIVEKDTHTTKAFEESIRRRIAPFQDVPIVFISAVTKQRIFKAMETALEVYGRRKQRISTSKLNELFLPIIEENPPPATKGKYIKIKYITQLPTPTPQFAFFANLPQYIRDPYKRFLENKFRSMFEFTGVPIIIYFRKK